MKLKLQRSQRAGGVLGGTVIFCLDARADYSPAESADIRKYKLGGEVVYSSQAARRHVENSLRHLDRTNSSLAREQVAGLAHGAFSMALAKMSLNISIASLGRGHHIECKDLPELLDAERALMEACRNVKQFLAAAATFSGSIILVDFDDDEKVHVSEGAPQLAALPPPAFAADALEGPEEEEAPPSVLPTTPDPGKLLKELGRGLRAALAGKPSVVYIGASVVAAFAVVAVFGLSSWSLLAAAAVIGGTVVWVQGR